MADTHSFFLHSSKRGNPTLSPYLSQYYNIKKWVRWKNVWQTLWLFRWIAANLSEIKPWRIWVPQIQLNHGYCALECQQYLLSDKTLWWIASYHHMMAMSFSQTAVELSILLVIQRKGNLWAAQQSYYFKLILFPQFLHFFALLRKGVPTSQYSIFYPYLTLHNCMERNMQ